MPTCGACGAAVRPDDRFCDQCGTVQPVPEQPSRTGTDGGAVPASRPDAHDEPGASASPSFTDPTSPALFARPEAAPDLGPRRTVQVDLDDEPTSTGSGDAPTEVVALTGGVDLATCLSCEAVNAVERLRCARCGAPLQEAVDPTDEDAWDLRALPSTPPTDDQPAIPPSRGSTGFRGLGIAVVVVGALLGAVLAAWVFGLGPFRRADGPGVDFVGSAYPGQARPVRPDEARTSPIRPAEGGREFRVAQAVDGDLRTAWVGVDGDDARLQFSFDGPVWVTAIEVANGDQHDDETFTATARVRTLDVDFGFGSELRATLLSGTGEQVFRPLAPVLTDNIMLEIVDTTDGADVALSEIEFIGFPANDADARSYGAAG